MTAHILPFPDPALTKPMPPDPKLTDTQLRALRWLVLYGSVVPIGRDQVSARMSGNTPTYHEDHLVWLDLLAAGCIYGSSGRIYPTELGRAMIGRRT